MVSPQYWRYCSIDESNTFNLSLYVSPDNSGTIFDVLFSMLYDSSSIFDMLQLINMWSKSSFMKMQVQSLYNNSKKICLIYHFIYMPFKGYVFYKGNFLFTYFRNCWSSSITSRHYPCFSSLMITSKPYIFGVEISATSISSNLTLCQFFP